MSRVARVLFANIDRVLDEPMLVVVHASAAYLHLFDRDDGKRLLNLVCCAPNGHAVATFWLGEHETIEYTVEPDEGTNVVWLRVAGRSFRFDLEDWHRPLHVEPLPDEDSVPGGVVTRISVRAYEFWSPPFAPVTHHHPIEAVRAGLADAARAAAAAGADWPDPVPR